MKWVKVKSKIDKKDWHLWFAWMPVVVHTYPDGNQKIAFLTKVLRRRIWFTDGVRFGIPPAWVWEYKELPETKWVSPHRWELETFSTITPCPTSMCVSEMWSVSGECPIDPMLIEPKIGSLWDSPCNDCKEEGPGRCYECPTYKKMDEEESPDLATEEAMKKAFKSVYPDPIKIRNCQECGEQYIVGRTKCDCEKMDEEKESFRENVPKESLDMGLITGHYEPCSNCGGELDENADCTNEECPLSTDEWKHEIDQAWEVKNAKRNKTIM